MVAMTGIVSVLAYSGLFNAWQLKFSDKLQASRPVSRDIVIVAVDENTLDPETGLKTFDSWTYDNFSKVLDNINKYGPRVVAFDFFFKNPRPGESDFAAALSKTPNPVIFYRMNPSKYDDAGYFKQEAKLLTNPPPLKTLLDLPNIIVSTAVVLKDDDRVVRRMMPFVYDEISKTYYENFPFAITRIALDGRKLPDSSLLEDNNYAMDLKNGQRISIPLEKGQMIINYASVPKFKTFNRIPFINVYNENFAGFASNPEELFKDKIVLIGPSAFFFQDALVTPTSAEDPMNGVEIHANALQTILDRAFLRNFTPLEQYGLIFLLCFASVFMFMYTKIRWSLLYLVLTPTAYTIAAPFAFKQGLILDLVHPYIALITAFISVYVYRYLTEFKEKIALRGAFGKYVNPKLVEQISEHPEIVKLGGEKRIITVLFTDLAHFTTISEKLTPESTVALLNEYFDAMSKVVMAEGGTLDKFEGDAIMAFFGAPIAQSDHAARAVRAALKMREELSRLVLKWQSDPPLPGGEKKPFIDVRCGLSTGEAIVGNIGSTARFDYTAIGDIVNLGSRLEGANKKYSTSIMASEATYELIKDISTGRELDLIKVMGKTKPIRVYEILGQKETLDAVTTDLLKQYGEGISLYHDRKFAQGLEKFTAILEKYPDDGPSKLYRQRCEVLRDFPPNADWDGVYEMGSK